MVYPFLPAISRGLGVPIEALAVLVSVRGFASILSPIFSPLSEKFGRRIILVASLILLCFGCIVLVLWPDYWIFGLSLVLIAIAKVVYDPAMQAYIGDTIAYKERGRLLAITEMSWAGSFLISVPIIGLVMERYGWKEPYKWLTILGLLAAYLLWRSIPEGDGRPGTASSLKTSWKIIRSTPVIWAAGFYIFLVMGANELLLIVYGEMMELKFALSLASLGLATAVIGGAEIGGEIITAIFVDRTGKRKFVIASCLVTCLMYGLIPFTSSILSTALISLFILFLFFEMSVVGSVPLMTELVPSARSLVMSIVLAMGGLGRGVGALIGPQIMDSGGFGWLGSVSALAMLLAIIILLKSIREAEEILETQ